MGGFVLWLGRGSSLLKFLSLEHGTGTKGGIPVQGATWEGCFDLQDFSSQKFQDTLGDKGLQQLREEVIIQNGILQQVFLQFLYLQFLIGVEM